MVRARTLACLPIALLIVGCGSSQPQQTANLPQTNLSAFMSDYGELRSGKGDEPAFVYMNPQANMAIYQKVTLDPITIWRGEESLEGPNKETAQLVADYFYTLVYERLSRDYQMVSAPEMNTLQIRIAITKLNETDTSPDAISTTIPQPNLTQQFAELAKGDAHFVGHASIEAEFRDSDTQAVLWAAIELMSEESVGHGYGWKDLENDLKYDADRIRYRLCEARGAECPKPARGKVE